IPLGVSSLMNESAEPTSTRPRLLIVMLPPLKEAICELVMSKSPARVTVMLAPGGERGIIQRPDRADAARNPEVHIVGADVESTRPAKLQAIETQAGIRGGGNILRISKKPIKGGCIGGKGSRRNARIALRIKFLLVSYWIKHVSHRVEQEIEIGGLNSIL